MNSVVAVGEQRLIKSIERRFVGGSFQMMLHRLQQNILTNGVAMAIQPIDLRFLYHCSGLSE